jgi:signal transduction histidine kinase
MHREQVNWILALLTLLALGATVFVMLRVEGAYREELGQNMAAAVEGFREENALKTPRDLRVDFGLVERLARRAEAGSSMIRQVYVAKRVKDDKRDEEILIHPFYHAAVQPNWREELAGGNWRAHPVVVGEERVGTVHIDVDTGALRFVRAAIGAVIGLIVLLLAVLVVRIFSQERVLFATHQVLEQNRRELIRLERLSLAGQLTANIFHDIRKPVTNIKHEIEDLSEALGGFAGATRPLRNMRDQVELFFDILNDLNIERFVRADQVDEEYVDVNRVLEQSVRLVRYERGATRVHAALQPELPLVLAHPYRLVQVFSNIILNAFQAMEGKGELRVSTQSVHGTETGGVEMVRVEISDNGPGIPLERQASVFTPFFTTKPEDKGTGLGLYISRMIVEQMGGRVELESQMGAGCKFIILLRAGE